MLALGVQAKKGWLYILLPQTKVEEGQKVSSKRWVATGLADTDKNVGKAIDMRKSRMSSKNKGLTDDSNVMFVMYVDLYLARKKRTVVDTTYAGYLYRSVKIKEFFRKIKLKDITQADVEQFLDHLFSADKCQMRTVKDIKVLFNGIMEQAVKDGLIADNPVKDAMINKSLALRNAKVKDDDFFSYREAQLFLERVESHKLYELFFVTLFFGLRREEVLGLRWLQPGWGNSRGYSSETMFKILPFSSVRRNLQADVPRSIPMYNMRNLPSFYPCFQHKARRGAAHRQRALVIRQC